MGENVSIGKDDTSRSSHCHAHLEELVAQRTAELRSAYAWLEQEFAARCLTDQALQKSEERFRALAEQSPASIFISRQDRFLYVNPAFERELGYAREELCAPDFNYLDLVVPEYHGLVRESHARHLAGEELPPYECVLRARNGRRMNVICHTRLIGEEKDLLGVAVDITERVRAERQRREYVHRLVGLREEERRRIARDLHDLIGPGLTMLGINLSLASRNLSGDATDQAGVRLNDSLTIVEQVTRQMREIMVDLRPPMLDDHGLAASVNWYAAELSRTVGFPIQVTVDDHAPRLPFALETFLFRILQEALTNAVKHAKAASIAVYLGYCSYALLLTVEDDGRGFEVQETAGQVSPPHWGLAHMREYAEAIGGRLAIDSAPGKGTRIAVRLSLRPVR